MAAEDLTRVLDEGGATYDLLRHAHTETAAAEADALGLAPEAVGKTLVVKTPDGYLRAVIAASARLDDAKLRELRGWGKKKVHLATEDDLARDYPEFELGAVPPLGGARRDPVVIDRRLAEQPSVVVEAGSHEESIRISTADLIRVADAEVADISAAA